MYMLYPLGEINFLVTGYPDSEIFPICEFHHKFIIIMNIQLTESTNILSNINNLLTIQHNNLSVIIDFDS